MDPKHHIFIDFENAAKIQLERLALPAVEVTMIVGAQQKKLSTEQVEQMLRIGRNFHLLSVGKTGRNALDFVLACELGRALAREPQTHYHIVSADQGFDALVGHLKGSQFNVDRHDTFADLPFLQGVQPPGWKAAASKFGEHLRHLTKNRPVRKQTLQAFIKNHLTEDEMPDGLDEFIAELERLRVLSVDAGEKVTYFDSVPKSATLPSAPSKP